MKTSQYNFLYEIDTNTDENWIIYNSRTGGLSSINSYYYNALKLLEQQNQEIADEECSKALKSCGFIVEDDVDEVKLVRYRMLQNRYDTNALSLTIAPTMACNFACVYCFERNEVHNSTMTEEVCEKLITFIEDRAKNISHLYISWYGGEPLLVLDTIEKLSGSISKICREYSLEYHADIITNGYYFTPDIARRLVKYGIGSVQITLDGPEEIHDIRRPLVDGQGTFAKIMDNVIQSAGIIKIAVRINTDIDNFHRAGEIVKLLKEANVYDKVHVYLGLVEAATEDYEANVLSVEEYSKFNLQFMQENEIDLMKVYPGPKGSFCSADRSNAYVIDSKGYLYRCWADIGKLDKNVGSIMEADKIPNMQLCMEYLLYDPTSNEKCMECKFLPICMGGCPHRRIENLEICSDKKYVLDEYLCECAKVIISKNQESKE